MRIRRHGVSRFTRLKVLWGVLSLLLWQAGCGAQENAAQRAAFDFEPGDARATQNGFTHVGPADLHSEERAFGWQRANAIDRAHDRDTPDSPFYFQRKDFALYNLVRDGVTVVGENTFSAKTPNGAYRVTLYVGDFSPNEERTNLFATLNGQAVMNDETTAGGTVKVFTFPVEVREGKITLVVEGRNSQKYFPLNGLVLEPAPVNAAAAEVAVAVQTLPEKQPSPANYALGWMRFVEAMRDDWQIAQAELKQEGLWSESWPQQRAVLRRAKNHRAVFAGSVLRFDDLAQRAGGTLDLKEFAAILREIGLDGVVSNNKLALEQFPKLGLQTSLMGPGFEALPAYALPRVDFTRIFNRKTGQVTVFDKVYTPLSPGARDFFREEYLKRFTPLSPNAQFLTVDEVRGLWSDGPTMGDYSDAAAREFQLWAREGNVKLASNELPRPARSWDFYHFYRFRMSSVARSVRAFARDTPLEKLPIYLGNGYLGPETVNHNSLWGPDAVKQGFGIASWDYDGNKASAEFLAAVEREHNGQVQNWTAFWRAPAQDLAYAAIIASAATQRLFLWHQGSFIQSANRVAWMKTAYLTTRLAHATGGVSHDTSVYVWAPDSLVFNDLVGDLPQAEFERWKQIARTLGEGNVDFKVTHTLQVPKNSLVIYAPVRAVLRPDEAATLAKYVADGGALLYASDSAPETPDAKPLTDLRAALNATNVSRATGALDAAAARRVAEQKKVALNPLCDVAGVRTFAFSRSGEKFVLFVNTDAKNTARMTLDSDYVDVFSGQKTARGAIELPAGYHRLLRR